MPYGALHAIMLYLDLSRPSTPQSLIAGQLYTSHWSIRGEAEEESLRLY